MSHFAPTSLVASAASPTRRFATTEPGGQWTSPVWRFSSTEPLVSRALACEAFRSHRAWWPVGRRMLGARSPRWSGRLERSQDAPDQGAGSWSDMLNHYPTKRILNQLAVEPGEGEG